VLKLELGNWNEISKDLDKIHKEIFKDVKINNLDDYTKRKMIFEYLCNNIKYDYNLLERIKIHELNPIYKIQRELYLEIESVLKSKMGICNAIAQVYKLLLEKVGIYSLCAICDDGTKVKHQLNLVYNEEDNSFSFDDVTSVIVNRGEVDDFFDYDLEDANKFNQGCRNIYENENWVLLPTSYIYSLVGKKDSQYRKHDIEKNDIIKLPENISSLKKKSKKI